VNCTLRPNADSINFLHQRSRAVLLALKLAVSAGSGVQCSGGAARSTFAPGRSFNTQGACWDGFSGDLLRRQPRAWFPRHCACRPAAFHRVHGLALAEPVDRTHLQLESSLAGS